MGEGVEGRGGGQYRWQGDLDKKTSDPSKKLNLKIQQHKKDSNRWLCVAFTHVSFQSGLFDSFEINIHVGVGGVAIVRVQRHLFRGDGGWVRCFSFREICCGDRPVMNYSQTIFELFTVV